MTNKRSCMARAKQLLQNLDEEALRYAALELRMCMEFLTYEKLQVYSDVFPPEVQEIWQPPQAVRTLLQLDQDADQDFSISIGLEENYGEPAKEMMSVGNHSALSLKWLRRHYNKIGRILHAPNAKGDNLKSLYDKAAYLREVILDLEAPLAGNILGGYIREVCSVTCFQCKKVVSVSTSILRNGGLASCFTPGCDTEYEAIENPDGSFVLKPILIDIECASCKESTSFQPKKLGVGTKFDCRKCGQRHEIFGNQLLYRKIET